MVLGSPNCHINMTNALIYQYVISPSLYIPLDVSGGAILALICYGIAATQNYNKENALQS